MSRRFTASLLALGLLGAIGGPSITTVANAQEEWVITDPTETGNTTPQKPAQTPPAVQQPATQPTATATATPAVPKRVPVTRASIEKLLEKGSFAEAEEAYLDWSGAWHRDDFELLTKVEGQLLNAQVQDKGDKNAFIALAQSGDFATRQTVRDMLNNGKTDLTSTQFATVIRALGTYGNSADRGLLVKLLTNTDPVLVDAAIDALGNLRDPAAIPHLYAIAPYGDLTRCVRIARAVAKTGGTSQLAQRYLTQLNMPLIGIDERASLMLCVSGNIKGWTLVKKMLDEKNPTYYPLALSVLGRLQVVGTQDYVLAGLKGNEQEQLAAIRSINALPSDEIDSTLKGICMNEKATLAVRETAVAMLGERFSADSAAVLQDLLASERSADTPLKTAAIFAAEQRGLLADDSVRGLVRIQMVNANTQTALAARAAMLAYAQRESLLGGF